jgi:hypothetical protein
MADRQRAALALVLAATALYLMAGAPWFRYRRIARIGAVVLYGVAMALILVSIALWLLGIDI